MNTRFYYLIQGTVDIINVNSKDLLDTEYFQFITTKILNDSQVLYIVKRNFLDSEYLNHTKYELDVSFSSDKINYF